MTTIGTITPIAALAPMYRLGGTGLGVADDDAEEVAEEVGAIDDCDKGSWTSP